MANSVVGIICEYNPFHLGHARQFEMIREKKTDAGIVCLMSGPFTQRGEAAILSPRDRAECALRAGADLVLELPALFSVRDADGFAGGAVSLLNRLGFIDYLSFGCEDDSNLLQSAADLLDHPTEAFSSSVREKLDAGLSPAAAQGTALAEYFSADDIFGRPNNILAIAYLRALARYDSAIRPLPVLREGNYHSSTLEEKKYPSAEAVRFALLKGDSNSAEKASGYSFADYRRFRPMALDSLLLWKLRNADVKELANLPDCTEGLENRLKKCACSASSRTELLDSLKTRRYSYTRLSRMLCHCLLGITGEMQRRHPVPEYVRLLGIRQGRGDLTANLKKSKIPVIAKAADGNIENELFALDRRAWELWALGAGLPSGLMETSGVVVYRKEDSLKC